MSGLIRLVLLGAITAIVAGAFVVVKNRQHALANERGTIESEIAVYRKQLETLDLRIAALIDRDAITDRIGEFGTGLIKIKHTETVFSGVDTNEEQFALYENGSSRDEL